MDLKTFIAELLGQTNCLVLPGLGGFIANERSAYYDEHRQQFLPPSRIISFNVNVSNNDGFLIHALASKVGVSYQDAEKRIYAFVQEVKFHLDQGKRITLDNVGYLVKNKEGYIIFEQDRFLNLLRAAYGLGQVKFLTVDSPSLVKDKQVNSSKPSKTKLSVAESNQQSNDAKVDKLQILPAETPPEEIITLNKDNHHAASDSMAEAGRFTVIKRIARIAAVAALVPMAFYSFWIPMKTSFLESKVLYLDDFNPFYTNLEKGALYFKDSLHDVDPLTIEKDQTFDLLKNQLQQGKTSFVFPITEDRYFHVADNSRPTNSSVVVAEKLPEINKPSTNETSKNKGFYLIAGCFKDVQNAQKLINDLKGYGFEAFIVDENKGLHRVSAAFSESRKGLEANQAKLKKNGINAWVLRQ